MCTCIVSVYCHGLCVYVCVFACRFIRVCVGALGSSSFICFCLLFGRFWFGFGWMIWFGFGLPSPRLPPSSAAPLFTALLLLLLFIHPSILALSSPFAVWLSRTTTGHAWVLVCACVCECMSLRSCSASMNCLLQFCVLFFFLFFFCRQFKWFAVVLICTSRKARCSFITLIFSPQLHQHPDEEKKYPKQNCLAGLHPVSLFLFLPLSL